MKRTKRMIMAMVVAAPLAMAVGMLSCSEGGGIETPAADEAAAGKKKTKKTTTNTDADSDGGTIDTTDTSTGTTDTGSVTIVKPTLPDEDKKKACNDAGQPFNRSTVACEDGVYVVSASECTEDWITTNFKTFNVSESVTQERITLRKDEGFTLDQCGLIGSSTSPTGAKAYWVNPDAIGKDPPASPRDTCDGKAWCVDKVGS